MKWGDGAHGPTKQPEAGSRAGAGTAVPASAAFNDVASASIASGRSNVSAAPWPVTDHASTKSVSTVAETRVGPSPRPSVQGPGVSPRQARQRARPESTRGSPGAALTRTTSPLGNHAAAPAVSSSPGNRSNPGPGVTTGAITDAHAAASASPMHVCPKPRTCPSSCTSTASRSNASRAPFVEKRHAAVFTTTSASTSGHASVHGCAVSTVSRVNATMLSSPTSARHSVTVGTSWALVTPSLGSGVAGAAASTGANAARVTLLQARAARVHAKSASLSETGTALTGRWIACPFDDVAGVHALDARGASSSAAQKTPRRSTLRVGSARARAHRETGLGAL